MTSTRALLLLLLLSAVAGGVWLLVGGLGTGGGAVPPPALPGMAPGALGPGPARATDALVGLAGTEEAGRAAAPTEVSDADPTPGPEGVSGGFWRAPKGSVWIEGRVELPRGTPLDESLIIVARGAAFENRSDGTKEMRVRADEQGRFRVAFAKKTRTGRLSLEGRYLYLSNAKKVKLREVEGEVVLEPKLGGRIAVTLLAPATYAMDEGVFDGVGVVASEGRGFVSVERDGIRTSESTFAIGGLNPGNKYVVIGRSPSFADGELDEVEVEPGQTIDVQLEFGVGITVAGEVVDGDGRPIAAAEVLVMTKGEADRRNPIFNQKQQAELTDRKGRFELTGAEPGELALIVESEGFLDLRYDLGELTSGQRALGLRLQVDRGEMLSGIVKWPDGEPADGARIRVAQKWGRGGFRIERVKADFPVGADGTFEVAALTGEMCSVTATRLPRGMSAAQIEEQEKLLGEKVILWSATRDEVEPGTRNLVLTLHPGNAIEGLVVDDRGEPVERFKVVATPAGTNMISAGSLKPLRARVRDERGQFELKGLQPAEWEVRVTAVGYGTPEDQVVTVPYGGGKLRYVLPRSGSISGLVVDPAGEPLPGARVLIDHGPRSAGVDTDAEGKFAVTKIVPGWVNARATAEGFGRSEPVRIQMVASGNVKNVRLELTPGATITGQLHPSVGELAERRVTLTGDMRQETTTDAQGQFEFVGLYGGKYEVRLDDRTRGPRRGGRGGRGSRQGADWLISMANRIEVAVEVEAGGRANVVLGAPAQNAVRIFGKITRSGEALPESLVTCFLRSDGSDPVGAVYSDGEGSYEITLDGAGEYRFMVGPVGAQATFFETVQEGAEQRIDFDVPTGSIVGKVTGPDGEAIAGVLVTLDDSGNSGTTQMSWLGRRTKSTDESGEYEFDGLGPGVPYVLRAGDTFRFNSSAEGLSRFVKADVEITDQQELRVDIELKRAGWIFGTVVTPAGAPLSGAEIVVLGAGDTPLSLNSSSSRGNGSFRYDGVEPGEVTVYARRAGKDGERVNARVFEGAGADLRLVVPD